MTLLLGLLLAVHTTRAETMLSAVIAIDTLRHVATELANQQACDVEVEARSPLNPLASCHALVSLDDRDAVVASAIDAIKLTAESVYKGFDDER